MRTEMAAAIMIAALAHGPAAAANWSIDPAKTRIAFAIDAVGYPRTEGFFRRFDGRIQVDFDHPDKSRVAFHVQSGSVDVGSASFGDYIKSPAFLDADKFPSIDFVSTSVERLNDRSVRVTGELTLLGQTRPLTVDVAVARQALGAKSKLDFRAETTINRLEFGMNAGFPLVGRDVGLTISSAAAEL
jgi:polyisoprenoid-binding protein YceI